MGRKVLRISVELLKNMGEDANYIVRVTHSDIPQDAALVDAKIQHDGKYLDLYWEHTSFSEGEEERLMGPTFESERKK